MSTDCVHTSHTVNRDDIMFKFCTPPSDLPIIRGNTMAPILKNKTLAATGTSCFPSKYFPKIENVAIEIRATPTPVKSINL